MPLAGQLRLSTRIAGGSPPPPLRMWTGEPPPLAAVVESSLRHAYDAPAVYVGAIVWLDGEDVTGALRGPVEVLDSVDELATRATFELAGPGYLSHRDLATWTRRPCRIVFRQGPSPTAMVAETVLDGVVLTHHPTRDGVRLEAADRAHVYGELEVCETVEPLAGLTRDAIAAEVAKAAGVDTDLPPGALYTKPVETAGETLGAWLAAFGEPENWSWRLGTDGLTLEAYVAELKQAPRAPDAVWRLDDLFELPQIQPPESVPSTWVLRGSSALTVDELGLETRVQTIVVEGIYAPVVATEQQLADGTVIPFDGNTVSKHRLIRRVTTTASSRGDRLIRQSVVEEGFRNPAAARLTTGGPGELGAGPEDGYYPLFAYLDEQGRYVAWPIETFGLIGRRDIDFHYDAAGTLEGESRRVYAYHRRRQAVRQAVSVDAEGNPEPSVVGTVIGEDGASYADLGAGRIEGYGLAERQELQVAYGEDGAQVGDRLETWAWGSVRTHVRVRSSTASPWVASGYYANADGLGMRDLQDTWLRVEVVERSNVLDADQRLESEAESIWRRVPIRTIHGRYDFGDYVSPFELEPWRLASSTSKVYAVLSHDQFQVTEIRDGRAGAPETLAGRPPVPLWQRSPWTTLVQTPLELVLDDDTLREWFGQETRVISNDYVQSVEEARRVLDRHLLRELSYEVRVLRPDTLIRPGATVLLLDRHQRFFRRCLVFARRRRRWLSPPRAEVECQLLSPLEVSFQEVSDA